METRQRWFGGILRAGLAGALLMGGVAGAEDVIVTQSRTFRGKVKSADTNGITIEIMDQGRLSMVTVPRSIVERATVEPPPSIVRGIEAYEKGNMKDAQLNLGKIMLQYQGLDVDWAAKGMICFARASLVAGDYEKAEQAFRLFLNSYPDHSLLMEADIGLAEIELIKKNYETALSKFRELAETYDQQLKPPKTQLPYAAELYMGIGQCLEGQSNPTEALDAYLRVLTLYPADKYYPEALFRSAMMYIRLHQLTKAERLLTELIENFPSSEFTQKAVEMKKSISARGGTEPSAVGSKRATR